MKKTLLVISLSFFYNISIGQDHSADKDSCDSFLYFLKSKEASLKYIENPCPNDSTCFAEISTAKSEIASGKLSFCMPEGLGIIALRQEEQLRNLCRSNGLNFKYELFSCVGNQGQTDGCYGLYMDKIIIQKFGSDFKEKLLKQADTEYVSSNPIAEYHLCDTLPRLPGTDVHESPEMDVPVKSELFSKLKMNSYGDYPAVEISFNIDTTGIPSNYSSGQLSIYEDTNNNNKFKKELTKTALDYVRQFKVWKPGVMLNQKVKTWYVVRVSFVSERKDRNHQ